MRFINSTLPIASSIRTILNLVVLVFVIYWLLSIFGLMPTVNQFFKRLGNIVTQQTISLNHGSINETTTKK